MSGLLTRVGALFLAPDHDAVSLARPSTVGEATEGPPGVRWQPPVEAEWRPASPADAPADGQAIADGPHRFGQGREPVDAVVLGAGADALALAAALAGELRVRRRARAALLLVWDAMSDTPAPMPASRGARNLASSLGERHDVVARGRLVQLQLPHEPSAAVAAADRLARTVDVPTVLVLAGPRASAFDDLLAGGELVVVLESESLPAPVAVMAAAQLRCLNRRVVVERPIGGVGRRLLALSGLARARFLGSRLDDAPL